MLAQFLRFIVAYLPILVVAGGLAWLTGRIPLLQPVAEEARRDWSRLSFLLYGGAPLIVMFQDEYRGLGSYQLASLAVLTGGALAYLRPASPRARLGTLLAALGLALGVLTAGLMAAPALLTALPADRGGRV